MRKLPSLKAMKCFERAAEYQSFTQASRSMNMTHAAIIYQIGLIEDWLGTRIFIRSNLGIQLTPNGRKLKEACSLSFNLLEETCAEIRDAKDNKVLHLGCASSFLIYWVIPLLADFNKETEQIDVVISTENDIYSLFNNKFDLMIADDGINKLSSITSEHLFDNHIGPVCSPSYDYSPSAAFDKHHLLHAGSHEKAWQEWASITDNSLEGADGTKLESLTFCIESAKAGIGLALTPRFLVENAIHDGKLIAPYGFVDAGRATAVYFRNDTEKRAEISWFCGWLKNQLVSLDTKPTRNRI